MDLDEIGRNEHYHIWLLNDPSVTGEQAASYQLKTASLDQQFDKKDKESFVVFEISIASINGIVKSRHNLLRHGVSAKLVGLDDGEHPRQRPGRQFKCRLDLDEVYDLDGKPVGGKIQAEIEQRIRSKSAATIDLGTKSLQPRVCLKVMLQVVTRNGLSAEDPKADPRFRVKLRYWDGHTHTRWADYSLDSDDLVVKIRKKPVKLLFANHEDVLTAIRDMMP
jgi:hypothetical protein